MNRRTALRELAAGGGLLFVGCGLAQAGQRRAVSIATPLSR